jgi:hypothetical protein
MNRPIGMLALIDAHSQNSSKGQVNLNISIADLPKELGIDTLTNDVDTNTSNIKNNMTTLKNQGIEIMNLQKQVNEQKDCIPLIINAINYLYQHWNYVLAIKAACGCKDLFEFSSLDKNKIHSKLVASNKSLKWTEYPVSKEVSIQVITTIENVLNTMAETGAS